MLQWLIAGKRSMAKHDRKAIERRDKNTRTEVSPREARNSNRQEAKEFAAETNRWR
tara:strand:- start:15168 stop:15335 length:168 start_codon:yes stop_codon:yes gene_type:complete